MGRRRKDDDWIGAVAQLAGLGVLLSFVYPPFRQALKEIGVMLLMLVLAGAFTLLAFGLYRWAMRLQMRKVDEFYDAYPPESADSFVPPPPPPNQSLEFTALARQPSAPPAPGPAEAHSPAAFIQQLHSIDWFQFEKLIAAVYRKLGYTVTRRGGAKPDGGIDLVIEKDGEQSAIQCKQWKTWNVGVKPLREFLGALTDAGIKKGVFVTLCGYTGEARKYALDHGWQIVCEADLAQMLEATGARFDPDILAILRDTRKFCPRCEREMALRTAGKGRGAGQQFWGCSAYPRCRYTMPLAN